MRVAVVTGGRDFEMYEQEWLWFLNTLKLSQVAFVLVGDCPTGVDKRIARGLKAFYEGAVFHAAWTLLGKSAGPIRNGRMAGFAASQREHGLCIAFPGGIGTDDCKRQCQGRGLQIREWTRDE